MLWKSTRSRNNQTTSIEEERKRELVELFVYNVLTRSAASIFENYKVIHFNVRGDGNASLIWLQIHNLVKGSA